MRRRVCSWSIDDLVTKYRRVNFPEYQREATVWSRSAKQRLIDSILRGFDIAPLYLYETDNDIFDCIDGRQRVGTIMSFLNRNEDDARDNGFPLLISNEVFNDDAHPFHVLSGRTWVELRAISKQADAPDRELASDALSAFSGYSLNVVVLSEAERPEEFNLQFTRLNLGTLVNAGEKLHAMIGALRDICFEPAPMGLNNNAFLAYVYTPTRRYAKEQIIAHIVAQAFFLNAPEPSFGRIRHYDLQKMFKENIELDAQKLECVRQLRETMTHLAEHLDDTRHFLRNRAIATSSVILAWQLNLYDDDARIARYAEFLTEFGYRWQWQVKKRLDIDDEYRYLSEFQKHVTQASVERAAFVARHDTLSLEFERWEREQVLRGDNDYRARTKSDPSAKSRG